MKTRDEIAARLDEYACYEDIPGAFEAAQREGIMPRQPRRAELLWDEILGRNQGTK